MNAQTRTSLGKAITILAGMAFVFTVLLVAADRVADSFAQLVLVSVGSALLGSGVTFFLIRATHLDDKK
jgi:hypothetical protein